MCYVIQHSAVTEKCGSYTWCFVFTVPQCKNIYYEIHRTVPELGYILPQFKQQKSDCIKTEDCNVRWIEIKSNS